MIILVQQPRHKSTSDSVGIPKNNQVGTIFIEFGDTKKCCTFSGLELVPKSSKKLIGGLSCMHKGQKCIQILWAIRKQLLLLKRTKNAPYVRCLGKNPILGHTQRLKNILHVVICAKHAPQRPKNNANPSWLSDKKVYCVESLLFCR